MSLDGRLTAPAPFLAGIHVGDAIRVCSPKTGLIDENPQFSFFLFMSLTVTVAPLSQARFPDPSWFSIFEYNQQLVSK
jgi:hypothetical protein